MAPRQRGKKRKTYKDPYRLLKLRYEKIKHKTNNPPKNADTQEVPKIFERIGVADDSKDTKRRKNKKDKLLNTAKFLPKDMGFYPANGRPFKNLPTLQQQPSETDLHFMNRVTEATKMVIQEAKFEEKFKVDVKRNEVGGVVGIKPRVTKEVEKKKTRKSEKTKEWSLKKKLKKKGVTPSTPGEDEGDASNDADDVDLREIDIFKKEHLAFDDIVHRPPELETAKLEEKVKAKKEINTPNFIFFQNLERKNKKKQRHTKAREKVLEIERERAVLAYRQIQAKKRLAR